jgi:RNA polymerase sigma factor (sigma-70 family)
MHRLLTWCHVTIQARHESIGRQSRAAADVRRGAQAAGRLAERLYESVGGVVLRLLTGKFRLPPEEAQALLCRVCVEAVKQELREREAWTIVMACNGAKTLRRWHDEGTAAPPPDITVEEIEALREVVLVNKALATLTERGRQALHLRFRERRSYAEIAAALDISTKYAEHLVFRSLERLRACRASEVAGKEEKEDR